MSQSDEAVGRVLDVVDLVADSEDVDPEDLTTEVLSRVRKRGEH